MKVIALTGMPGAGKSVVIDKLKSEGYKTVYMGSVVRTEMTEKNIDTSSKNVRNFATELRKEYGDDIVAKRILPELQDKLSTSEDKPVIIEDIKGIAEVEFFRKELGENFVLIAIHASPHQRYIRSRDREQEWDDKTIKDFEEFQWRDRKEIGWGLADAIALADYIIMNESTEADLIDRVKEVITQIMN